MNKNAWLVFFTTIVFVFAFGSSAKILDPQSASDPLIDSLEQHLDTNGIDIRRNWQSGNTPASSARPQLAPLAGYQASGVLQVPPIDGTSFAEILTKNAKQPVFETVVLGVKWEPIVHTVTSGDTLSAIAKKYSGNASNWRLIAEANKIDETQAIRVGQKLVLPGFPYTDAVKLRIIWNKADKGDRVFISFARADAAHARVIATALNGRGYTTFLYLQDALAQPTFSVQEFAQFFEGSGNRYVLDTPNARASPAVALEAKLAESLSPARLPLRTRQPGPIVHATPTPREMTGHCSCRYARGTPPPSSCDDPRCGSVVPGSAIPNRPRWLSPQ